MTLSLFIARRYLVAKKSTNAINVISAISGAGVLVAAAALVVVMSVFNGFRDMTAAFQTNFDPQLKITAAEGKTFAADDPVLAQVRALPQVAVATECVEDMVVAVYHDQQMMLTLKGVDDNFAALTHITDCLYGQGEFCLHAGAVEYGVLGVRAAQELGFDGSSERTLTLYAARREGQLDLANPATGFVSSTLLLPYYVFSVGQARYDSSVCLAPIAFARRLFHAQGEMTSLELRLREGEDINSTKKELRRLLGARYKVEDRYEQQADTFRIMQIEKMLAYIFLTFILLVACFNIIGSMSMLMLDKRDAIVTLHCLGASRRQIVRIFLVEGWLLTAIGALAGVAIGLLLCFLQQQYGFVSMGESGVYIVDAYPVSVHYGDVLLVVATVLVVGAVAVWYPVRYMSRRLIPN